MKVIEGNFNGKDEKIPVPKVFDAIMSVEKLEEYKDAFCIIKSEEFVVVSTNIDPLELYFVLDQLKMSLLTGGEYEL